MNKRWWMERVIYQIYPRSFRDTNGDGIGDLPGIIEKLDYLKSLGVGALWLSPVYASPNIDMGYDVSDYYSINAEYGSMADMELLIEAAHAHDLKLIMDLVVNHTSDKHPWFIESRSSRDSSKRDWYIWKDASDGHEPNNWANDYGESAWEWDENTEQYYLHLFSKSQPDLNWRNEDVRKEIYTMMNWWLDKGVDGYRMDMINFILKARDFRNAPLHNELDQRTYIHGEELYANQPGIHTIYHEMREKVFRRRDVVSIGEMYFINPETVAGYAGFDSHELDLVLQMDPIKAQGNWQEVNRSTRQWYEDLEGKAWNTIHFSNHDSPRPVSILGDAERYHFASAKAILTYTLTGPGTPIILQGEEIGMTNAPFTEADQFTDIKVQRDITKRVESGESIEGVVHDVARHTRDNSRTPMQWSPEDFAGFSSVQPWMFLNPNYTNINVQDQDLDQDSVLAFFRKLTSLRVKHPSLVYGDFEPIGNDDWVYYGFTRTLATESILVIFNLTSEPGTMERPSKITKDTPLLLSNYPLPITYTPESITLRPWEIRIYQLSPKS